MHHVLPEAPADAQVTQQEIDIKAFQSKIESQKEALKQWEVANPEKAAAALQKAPRAKRVVRASKAPTEVWFKGRLIPADKLEEYKARDQRRRQMLRDRGLLDEEEEEEEEGNGTAQVCLPLAIAALEWAAVVWARRGGGGGLGTHRSARVKVLVRVPGAASLLQGPHAIPLCRQWAPIRGRCWH